MSYFLSLHAYTDWGLLALRLVIAAIFWAHGMSKFKAWKQPAQGLNGMMRLLSICEPLGAIAMLTGFLTQPAAIGLGLVMVGAAYLKATKWQVPFYATDKSGWEFDLLILAACLLLLATGAGMFSIDRMWLGL